MTDIQGAEKTLIISDHYIIDHVQALLDLSCKAAQKKGEVELMLEVRKQTCIVFKFD